MTCINCDSLKLSISSKSAIQNKCVVNNYIKQTIKVNSSINILPTVQRKLSILKLSVDSSLQSVAKLYVDPKPQVNAEFNIKSILSSDLPLKNKNGVQNKPKNLKADKFSGKTIDFIPYEKLFPLGDISFKNKSTDEDIDIFQDSDVYSRLDEGIFIGLYTQNNSSGELISDDNNSIMYPINVNTDEDLEYKFKVTTPLSTGKKSYFAIRALAPFDDYRNRRPQQYKIYNIELRDPNNNLIIKYEDIVIRGDTYFTTYISQPVINNLSLPTWDENYPDMDIDGDYTISISIQFDCLTYPFNEQFNENFEENCVYDSTKLDNSDPLKDTVHTNLQISAIEIGSSGAVGIATNNYISLHTISTPANKVTKKIIPSQVLLYDSNNGIYPESNSVWENYEDSSETLLDDNTSIDGCLSVLHSIQNSSNDEYIKLLSSSAHPSSGRLLLKFTNDFINRNYAKEIDGNFNSSFSNKNFKNSHAVDYTEKDIYFDAKSIKLEVIAKKYDSNVPDYYIDVVGYSNDKLLCITSPVGGFLQNDSSLNYISNEIPDTSGVINSSLSISEESISGDSDYYQNDITPFGDHYDITITPIVNSTNFVKYTIPLEIKYNENLLGKQNFSLSVFLDNLYLDIAPLPEGAVISYVRLVIEHDPSDALSLSVVGSPSNRSIGRKTFNFKPTYNDNNTQEQLDKNNIPHGLTTKSDIKTNYSRRWRGVNNSVASGAFDVLRFDNYEFEFYYPTNPFLYGYVDFSNTDEVNIYNDKGSYIGFLDGDDNSFIVDKLYQNIGWRLSNDQLFNNNPITPYKSISWASNIYDGFDRALRLNGQNSFINLGNVQLGESWAIFIRFTPDNIQPFNQSIISKTDGTNINFELKYEEGYLYAKILNGYLHAEDHLYWDQYQYPLSVLVTYNDDGNNKLKLYTDNELSEDHDVLVNQSLNSEAYVASSDDLYIGNSNISNAVGLPMFVHEFGISNIRCNLVPSSPNRQSQQINIEDFFKSHRMHFRSNTYTSNRSEQHTYVNDDIAKWHLGAFKICSFSPAFDFFTKRDGDSYLQHKLIHDGSEYSVDSINGLSLTNISYHTQVENDFLRFGISEIPDYDEDAFYAVPPRINKKIPKGYNFNEEAICIDTILEYKTNNNLTWGDGTSGPKLIVSLYSNTLNEASFPSKDFGLINRSIHKLENSGCYQKYTSKFTFNDLFDTSESWALFDTDVYKKEFKERLFSNNINDMFLQYDIVYPTGDPHESYINLHSVNVRTEKALGFYNPALSSFELYCSGNTISNNQLNLLYPLVSSGVSDHLMLFNSGDIFTVNSDLKLISSGAFISSHNLDLFIYGSSTLDNDISLYTSGNYFSESTLGLRTVGAGDSISNFVKLISYNIENYTVLQDNQKENSLNLLLPFTYEIVSPFSTNTLNLFTEGSIFDPSFISNSIPLLVSGIADPAITASGSLSLFVSNHAASEKWSDRDTVILWNKNNVGLPTDLDDQPYLYVDQDDDIRGVDIMCYGNCGIYNVNECTETPIIIHDTVWYEYECVDGGILRAQKTYSNSDLEYGAWKHTENGITTYSTDVMYNGHFYGTRKYTNLIPYGVYSIVIEGATGSTRLIDIPPECTEIEYNKLEIDFNENTNESMDYNGFTLVNDDNSSYDYVNNPVNEFGKSVSSKNNLLAIGAPGSSVECPNPEDLENPLILEDAGSVFLYRRKDRPTDRNWPVDEFKSPWILEEKLSLPSGLRSDYSLTLPEDNILVDENLNLYLQKSRWFTGQDGRRFGHSVDIAINENISSLGEDSKQIVVVGGPSAKFTRQFYEEDPEYVNICLFIFTDKFDKTTYIQRPGIRGLVELTYKDILRSIENKDLIFDYFGDPRIKFNVQIILYVAVADNVDKTDLTWVDAPSTNPLHINVVPISRYNPEYTESDNYTRILNNLKSGFNQAFSSNTLPPISVLYKDSSYSFKSAIPDNVVEDFLNYYKTEFENNNENLSPSVTIYETEDSVQSENWILLSEAMIKDLLDIQNLISRNQLSLLGTTIRTPQPGETRADYNIPPDSGGRVYVFEKESGNWNLIQEIRSPQIAYGYPDQFGHAVSISDNAEVIVVGSPYITEAVSVFEYKSDAKKSYYNQLYSWIVNNRRSQYSVALENYSKDLDIHNLYLSLTPEDKFKSRLDLNINEYQKIHTLSYGDIQPIGSWSFIPNSVAPTSRLGYSVDVNDKGDKVVVGAPTDSMNLFNDADIYYAHNDQVSNGCDLDTYSVSYNGNIPGVESSWAASVNAGSIYVLESRKYYPHDTVMEYGRFGNLHRKLNKKENDNKFDLMQYIYYDKEYLITDQSTNEIPQNVGLLFIVTPETDVLSDEVVDNIIDWLALGDRNLVLVGNDPIWESNGAYKVSNQVINKLLRRLNSRMQIVAARNKLESLPNGYTNFDNILPAYIPFGTTSSYIRRLPLKASGVGDIKMYYGDNSNFYVSQDCKEVGTCMDPGIKIQIQTQCALPLMHNGDLRAEWFLHCCNERGADYIYSRNWALEFGSYIPACADESFSVNPMANHEPIPLLTAAEKVSKIIDVPTVPAKYGQRYIRQDLVINDQLVLFTDPVDNNVVIKWDKNTLPSSLNINYTNKTNIGRFFQPSNTGVLQANAELRVKDISFEKEIVIDEYNRFCVKEEYIYTDINTSTNKISEIVLIPSLNLETQASLDGQTGVIDYDQNIRFYADIVANKNNLAQLSLWNNGTSPASFSDAFSDSIIGNILKDYVVLRQGVNSSHLLDGDRDIYNNRIYFDIAWIANAGKYEEISDIEIQNLKNWLNSGNKRLIITFDYYATEEEQRIHLTRITNLCQKLGLSIKPLSYLGKYLYNNGGNSVLVNFGESYSILAPQLAPFHPISIADKTETRNVTTIAYQDIPIKTSVTETTNGNYWYSAAGIAKASFSVKENTGYRLFFTTEKYSDEDSIPLSVNIGNANSIPSSTSPSLYPIQLYDFNLNDYVTEQVNIDADGDVLTYTLNNRGTEVIDVQTGDGQTSLDIYISSNIERANVSIESISPRTLRLIAVSGVELKIDTQINTTIIPNGGDIIGVEDYLISEEVPGYSITTDLIRPISTDNTVYCSANCLEAGLGGRDIEDGPVVAAQEIEFITPFEAGYKRSRVTLLTDPSIIQGDYIDDNGVIPTNTFEFIRSLYPETNFEQQNAGRQFTIQTKIISPERGSPTKLLNYDSNLTGLTSNFGSYTSISENINHFKYESQYLPELVDRPKLPWHSCNDGNKIQEIQDELVSGFYRQTDNFGSFCRFSGVIDNVTYIDVGIAGGIPDIMKDKGYDYLDLEKFDNGYPGDLFGYSVAIEEGKILVGSPFAGFNTNETIRPWDETSEFYLGNNGGPGAVYMFEKTDSSWSCTRKFRPETLMGQISGVNVYSDQFGRSVAIRGDMIAIGAPKHDYGNYVTNNYGEFVRKSFDSSLDITTRTVQDLGNSGIRDQLLLNNVDTAVNSGAIYAYENRIMNWENRSFAWNLVQKVVNNSNNSQDFGKVIHLGKSNRTDSDYVLSAGSDSIINQNYGTGIAYSQDIMLRANRPSSQNSDISLHAKVIGAKSYDPLTLSIVNNGENSVSYYTEGLIRATEDGYLFLEVSGQDPSIGGFIEHRPYIKAITGSYNYGVKTDNNFNLIVNGINPLPSSILNMSILGE